MHPLQGTRANMPINLTLPETKVNGLHFLAAVWVYLHSNFRGGLRKRMYFETECVTAVQGHAMSLIFAPIESAYATSYWSSIVT